MNKALGSSKIIWLAMAIAFAYVIWFNFHKFVVTKSYDFFVEAPCDLETESGCYARICEKNDCSPEDLEPYKVWKLLARDYEACTDETCDAECSSGEIFCEAVPCDSELGGCA